MDEYVSNELEILIHLFNLRMRINKVFLEEGPASNEFILLSHDLEVLLKKYQERS